jgi:hypothetical protein
MNKEWYKERIYGYQCRAVSEITTALLSSVPKRKVLINCRALLNDLIKTVKIPPAAVHSLWNWTVTTYNHMSKRTWGKRSEESIQEAAIREYRAMTHEKNLVADRIEFDFKHDRAMSYINSDTAFYQLSTHANPADGHEPYQGKIFLNEDKATPEERKYALAHNIPTIREMMFSEPFLTTRTNCKHFFIPVSSEEVMTNRVPKPQIIQDPRTPSGAYRAYADRKKLLIAAGVSKKNDSYKRTVFLIRKHKLR